MRFCLSIRGAINIDKSILAGKPIRKLNEIIIKSSTKTPLAVADGTSSIKSFTQLRLREEVITALQSINITHPTAIQMLAIPQILKGKNVLCAGETGSGKTLAYLLPLVNRLKDEEINHGLMTRLRKPRAVVIVPTRDLANQVLLTIKSISHVVKLRCIGLIGGRKRKFIKEALLKPVDVIVATPYSLLRFSREERLSFGDVSHLVIDEADTMFEDTFEEPLTHILKFTKIRTAKPKTSSELGKDAQVTFVSATLSNKMMTALNQKIPVDIIILLLCLN
jgi:superfamily II DNA/RNA helicase